MKVLLGSNADYFGRQNLTAAICCEVGEPVRNGDCLFDISADLEYIVLERGFRPKRSAETVERAYWSRETSLSFLGDCRGIVGRILADENGQKLPWKHLKCSILKKSGRVPVGIPIAGTSETGSRMAPGVMLVAENIAEIISVCFFETKTIRFSCRDVRGLPLEVLLCVSEIKPMLSSGRVLIWPEIDEECVYI